MIQKIPFALIRFAKYTLIGSSTFLLDLIILAFLIEVCKLHSLWSTGIAFLCAITINYLLSRTYVFPGSLRDVREGYFNFLIIGILGLVSVVGLMYVFTVIFHFHYMFARFCVALMTGFWNYLLNLYVNFKVAGKHTL